MYPNVVFTYLMSRNVVGIRELGRTTYGMLGDRRDARGRDERCVRWWDDRLQNKISYLLSSVSWSAVSATYVDPAPSTQHQVALRSQACAFCVLFAVLLCLWSVSCPPASYVLHGYVLCPAPCAPHWSHTSLFLHCYLADVISSVGCWSTFVV